MHNVLNSLAVIAVADRTGISFEVIQKSLAKCQGARRRFEIAGEVNGITVIDDYAHHPGEIRATIDAARRCGYKRIVAVFQPHLYSRTRELMDGFVESLSEADSVYVTGIYKAREEAVPGVSSGLIVEKLKSGNHRSAVYVQESGDLVGILQKDLRAGDAVILMGAGDIWQSAVKLVEALNG
jgi:UDP-N-acetylmuramate--alanine ligase